MLTRAMKYIEQFVSDEFDTAGDCSTFTEDDIMDIDDEDIRALNEAIRDGLYRTDSY